MSLTYLKIEIRHIKPNTSIHNKRKKKEKVRKRKKKENI